MNNIIIEMPSTALVPTIDCFKQYFDEKYPCTNEDNDGSNMPIDDQIKYGIYNKLLEIYESNKDLYDSLYSDLKSEIVEEAAKHTH